MKSYAALWVCSTEKAEAAGGCEKVFIKNGIVIAMSIYTKPLSQLTTSDLQELVSNRDVENVRLEFKLTEPKKDEALKKLSSFANTYGGFLVVGAKAHSDDGRVEDLPGIVKVAGYKQKLVDWSFAGVSPPMTVEISDPILVPAANGNVCYVIYVPESETAPHFLNGRRGIWIRTDEFSGHYEPQLADETELRHLFDRRKLVLERRADLLQRAHKRFCTHIANVHPGLGDNKRLAARLEISVIPRFPSRQLLDQAKLSAVVAKASIPFRDVSFPRHPGATISQQESLICLNAFGPDSYFELNVWGMLFYGLLPEEEYREATGIHLHQFLGNVLLSLLHARKTFKLLGYKAPAHIQFELFGVPGLQWLHLDAFGSESHRRASGLDHTTTFSIATTGAELDLDFDTVVKNTLRYLFFSINWADSVDSSEKLDNLVRTAYHFNSWTPDNIKSF